MAYLASNDFLILIQISVLPYFSRPIFHLLCSPIVYFFYPAFWADLLIRVPPVSSLPPSLPSFTFYLPKVKH